MEYLIIGLVAAFASLLTFFSGFGLGTILTPVFILFFPPPVAIALTAIVHFLNNLFKISLVYPHIRYRVVLLFGLPAMLAAFGGATLLFGLANNVSLTSFELFGSTWEIYPVNLAIGLMMITFSVYEILPQLKGMQFSTRWLVPGGLLSGFFGGLSGHQGALRTAFLIRLGLTKEQFISTGVSIACLVDLARMSSYASSLKNESIVEQWPILTVATLSAFVGALLGKKLLEKVTLNLVQNVVALLMILLGVGLALGFFDKH